MPYGPNALRDLPLGLAGLSSPRGTINGLQVEQPNNPLRVQMLAGCQPDEIAITSTTRAPSGFGGLAGWVPRYRVEVAPETTIKLYGSQSLKLSKTNVDTEFAMAVLPLRDNLRTGDARYAGWTAAEVRSGVDVWLYIPTGKLAELTRLTFEVSEQASDDPTIYRRASIIWDGGVDSQQQGIVEDTWCRVHLNHGAFTTLSTGANAPLPWGWVGGSAQTSSHSGGKTTITSRRKVFRAEHVGKFYRVSGVTGNFEILEVGSLDSDGNTATCVVNGNTSAAAADAAFTINVPAPTYPVRSMKIMFRSVNAADTPVIYIGGIVAVDADIGTINLQVDEPFKDSVDYMLPRMESRGWRADLNVMTHTVGYIDGSGNQLYSSWDELREYERRGHWINSHSSEHTNTIPRTFEATVSGTTITITAPGTLTGGVFAEGATFSWTGATAATPGDLRKSVIIAGSPYKITAIAAGGASCTVASAPGDGEGVACILAMPEDSLRHDHAQAVAMLRRQGLCQGRPMICVPPNTANASLEDTAGVVTGHYYAMSYSSVYNARSGYAVQIGPVQHRQCLAVPDKQNLARVNADGSQWGVRATSGNMIGATWEDILDYVVAFRSLFSVYIHQLLSLAPWIDGMMDAIAARVAAGTLRVAHSGDIYAMLGNKSAAIDHTYDGAVPG